MILARPWHGARILLASAVPLQLTFWVLVVGSAVIFALIGFGVALDLGRVRDDRRREHVHAELGPVFSRFLETDDSAHLAAELRPAFMRMDAAHRPEAALLTIDVMQRPRPFKRTSSGKSSSKRGSWNSGRGAPGGCRRGDERSRASCWGRSVPTAQCLHSSRGSKITGRR